MNSNSIIRSAPLNRLKESRDLELIKVVTGIRRCGKSTLLKQYVSWLLSDQCKVSPDQVIEINLEDPQYRDLDSWEKLYDYINDRLQLDAMNYVIVDEVQNVPEFHRAIDGLFIKDNVDSYVTGSNAYMLSSKIATVLSGRYIEVKMLPFSFAEYRQARGEVERDNKVYSDYIQNGGFPYTLNLHSEELLRDYLSGVYNTILIKDVVNRDEIIDASVLDRIAKYIYGNIGNRLSIKKIADALSSGSRKISPHTVDAYLNALIDSYAVYRAKRFNLKSKEVLKTNDKYYIPDTGLRYYLFGSRIGDYGLLLENVVYFELLRRGFDVYIGVLDEYEIDFVAQKNGELYYFQVCQTLSEETTRLRELRPLQLLRDSYPKTILTLDVAPESNTDGILVLNAIDWLLGHRDRPI
ncbi:MAG: ATP-binding protein [Candidatus Ancillula sp.]|jgi:predicted AAA+ superfamily ATPase|nr:ATP-binding protein [Candidatus Ancillula sp.]